MADMGSGGSPGTFAGGLGGFLSGFQGESENIRSGNDKKQALIDARNAKVFETLANADDPDIRAAAVTGLLTGQHPAKGMDKWFGKVQEHPIYDTIKGLVAEGHQPFMDPTKRHGAELEADIDAKMQSIQHSGLPPASQERAKLGVYGAPPPRPLPLQSGTIHLKDGTSTAGFFDPAEGAYYDTNYQPVDSAVRFERGTGGGNPSAGSSEKVEPDPASPTKFSHVKRDATGKEIFRAPAPAPGGPESYTPVPTAGGIQAFGNRSGSIRPAGGGAGVTRAEAPSADVTALRSIEASILHLHPDPKPLFAGGSVSPDKQAAVNAARDAEAKHYGYDSYAALQAAIGSAAGSVDAATPPPQVPPGLGAKPAPKAAPAGGKPAAAAKGKIDVNAILDALKQGRAGAAAPPR